MDIQKVTLAIETFCSMGCASVNAVIHTIESGNPVDGIEDFSEEEIDLLTHELKAIMAVYDRKTS